MLAVLLTARASPGEGVGASSSGYEAVPLGVNLTCPERTARASCRTDTSLAKARARSRSSAPVTPDLGLPGDDPGGLVDL